MPYEDFTSYVEEEPDDRIQKTANHVDHATDRDELAYLVSDKTVDHFGDFTHYFNARFYVTALRPVGIVWMLSNELGDFKSLATANKTALCINFYKHIDAGDYRVQLKEAYNGTEYSDVWNIGVSIDGVWKYFKVVKSGVTLTVTIYPTSIDRMTNTNADDILTLTLHADHKFRYIFACNTYNDGASGYTSDDDIENLEIEEGTISGVTRDSSGAILASCTVWLCDDITGAKVASTTSDAVTGAFTFTGLFTSKTYYIRAFKDGTPNVMGVTDDGLTES